MRTDEHVDGRTGTPTDSPAAWERLRIDEVADPERGPVARRLDGVRLSSLLGAVGGLAALGGLVRAARGRRRR